MTLERRLWVIIAVGGVLGLLPALSALAFSPDWAKPYLKLPTPTGAYIAKDDWVALRREIDISATPDGMLVTTFRLVLAPTGKTPKVLALAMDYDSKTQTLENPQVWEPGTFGYRRLNLEKASLDFPELSSGMLTSGRFHYVTTERIKPGKKAIVTWRVLDRYTFPGEVIVWPFGMYPAADFVVRSDSSAGQGVHLTFVKPNGDRGPSIDNGILHLKNLPSMFHVYQPGIPWLKSRYQALPFVLALSQKEAGRSWLDVAARVFRFFGDSAGRGTNGTVRDMARALTVGKTDVNSKIDALVHFVASLSYRNIQWGSGAYAPAPPEETLRSMSGDCKAKALLLEVLLESIGIKSTPVLCRAGGHYLSPTFSLPLVALFDHVVLAVKAPGAKKLAATLTTGPGKGWVLVDPTDPQASFGRQPAGLEGAQALWLSHQEGGYFQIHTETPALTYIDAGLSFTPTLSGEASFNLTIKGDCDFLEELVSDQEVGNQRDGLRRRCERFFQSAVPGIEVHKVFYLRGASGTAPRLKMEGSVPDPLQDIGGHIFTCTAPIAILGRALGVPTSRYAIRDESMTPPPANPLSCSLRPDYQATGLERSGTIRLILPDGWSVQSWPAPERTVAAPWMTLTVMDGNPWTVRVSSPRGAFQGATEKIRLADLNSMVELFNQPCLIRESLLPTLKR